MKYFTIIVLIFSLFLIGCEKKTENKEAEDVTMLKEKIARFVPTKLKYDSSTLDEREKIVVEKLYLASKIMDELFLDQVYSKNYEIRKNLMEQSAAGSEKAKLELELFTIMFGPFDRLEHDAPFIDTFQPEADEPLAQKTKATISDKLTIYSTFNCPCGRCGIDELKDCNCEHPGGAKEIKRFVDEKIS